MNLLADRLRRVDDGLSDSGVDIGLGEIARSVELEESPSRAIATAADRLRERGAALKEARDSIKRLQRWVAYTRRTLPLTEDGWEERRGQLERMLHADWEQGIAAWLEDAFRAMSEGRQPAVGRLTDLTLPPGLEVVADRFVTAARGLSDHSWPMTAPLLETGAAGIELGDRTVPVEGVRRGLRLLLARLAIQLGMREEAADHLRALEGDTHAASAVLALRSRMLRLDGDIEGARRLVASASTEASTNLDFTIELIEHARDDGLEDLALEAARTAVAALPTLSDIDAVMARLVREPPEELWVAVAERALAEGDLDVHLRAADLAQQATAYRPSQLRAIVAEMRARSAAIRGLSREQRVDLLLWAGSSRVDAGQYEMAMQHFRDALDLDPEADEAALRLADCKIEVARFDALSAGRRSVEEALELITGVQRRGPVPDELSWSYLSEAEAHGLLARAADRGSTAHRWHSFLAACRSVVHDPESSARWVSFADWSDQLGLFRVAEVGAGRAYALDPDSDGAISQRIQALVNSDNLDQALELLEAWDGPWEEAVRGYVLARAGDPLRAVEVLRTADLDPTWFWASHTLILALLMTDRFDEAIAQAHSARVAWADRHDEIAGKVALGWTSLVLGDFDQAIAAGREIKDLDPEGQGAMIYGCGLILARAEGGVDALVDVFSRTRVVALLREWRTLAKPALRVLAARHSVALPSLEDVDGAVERRYAKLERRDDPVEDLRRPRAPFGHDELVAIAVGMGAALVLLARDDAGRARDIAEGVSRDHPQDSELIAVGRYAAALATAHAATSPREVSRELSRVLDDGPADAAPGILRILLDRAGDQAAAVLSTGDGSASPGLLDVLVRLDLDPTYRARAAAVRMALTGSLPAYQPPVPTTERLIRVLLPTSWFEGHEDPVNDHLLFVRYLPEIRARANTDLPGVNISTDDDLDPDGYVVFIRDRLVETGRIDPACLYAREGSAGPLGAEVEPDAVIEDLGLVRLPPDFARDKGGLAPLLTMTAGEAVARRIAELADRDVPTMVEQPAPQV